MAGFDSVIANDLGKALDGYYVNKMNDGYMYVIIGRKGLPRKTN